jgi:histidine triad (HIT) family protein
VDDCVFCKIIAGQLPAAVVYRDETVMAFMSLQQLTEGHTLVIPIRHFKNVYELPDDLAGPLLSTAARIARAVKREFKADGIWVSQFNERAAGQSVFHYHIRAISTTTCSRVASACRGHRIWRRCKPWPRGCGPV